MPPAEWLTILCLLNPCFSMGGTLHVPVPEVGQRMPPELWPKYNLEGFQIRFVPIPNKT
jgi:hypothetical protein